MDYKQTVKAGYNAIARQYIETRMKKSANVQLLEEFAQKLPAEASVLDAGCGAGVPIAKILSERFQVTGVDFSETQIELAE